MPPMKPTYQNIAPQEIAPFTRSHRLEAMRRSKWGGESQHRPILPATFDIREHVSKTAVAAIRKAFTQSKTSHAAWRTVQREGRFDTRSMVRAARSEQDVFKRKTGRSTTHIKCAVLVDDSGSMSGRDSIIPNPAHPGEDAWNLSVTRKMGAAIFSATIAEALGSIPTVDLDVYQHAAGLSHYSGGSSLSIKWRWHKGTPMGVFNEQASGHNGAQGGGNADGHALYAIATKMLRDLKRGERGVIMVVSDGLPSVYAKGGTGDTGSALIDAVAFARKNGLTVLGVAIDGSDQSNFYGDGLVRWTGNWSAIGKSLAKVIGSALAAR